MAAPATCTPTPPPPRPRLPARTAHHGHRDEFLPVYDAGLLRCSLGDLLQPFLQVELLALRHRRLGEAPSGGAAAPRSGLQAPRGNNRFVVWTQLRGGAWHPQQSSIEATESAEGTTCRRPRLPHRPGAQTRASTVHCSILDGQSNNTRGRESVWEMRRGTFHRSATQRGGSLMPASWVPACLLTLIQAATEAALIRWGYRSSSLAGLTA